MLLRMFHAQARALLLASLLLGCGDDEEPPSNGAFFPADYRTAYEQVRDCRMSSDHDLAYVIVYADPDASQRYLDEQYPFAAGTVIVKEEFSDEQCSDLIRFTAMRKAAAGEHASTHGWEWQTTDNDLKPVATDEARCATCHAVCESRDFTCALP